MDGLGQKKKRRRKNYRKNARFLIRFKKDGHYYVTWGNREVEVYKVVLIAH